MKKQVMRFAILVVLVSVATATGCSKKEESKSAAAPAAQNAPAASPSAATSQEAPATSPAQTQAVAEQAQPPAMPAPEASPGPCCSVVPNPEMKGRMGRLVVIFPEGVGTSTTVSVFKAGEQKSISHGWGGQALDLLPGTYAVSVNNKRVEGVTVKSGHDTKLKVGVLRFNAGNQTTVTVLDADKKRQLSHTWGSQALGFPIGTVYVSVAGQSEAVTIQDGKITDF